MIAGPQRRASRSIFPGASSVYLRRGQLLSYGSFLTKNNLPCSRSHSRHRVFTVQSIFVYRTKRHCLCSQTYESLCSVSLLPYHSRSPTLHVPPLPLLLLLLLVPASSLPGVLHLLSGLFPLLERAPSRATGRGAQKRSDSDSKVGERFIGVAGSSTTIKESEKQRVRGRKTAGRRRENI